MIARLVHAGRFFAALPARWKARSTILLLAASGVLLGLAFTGSCKPYTSAPGASVLIVSIDTLRADRLGAYGGAVATPNIDAFAQDSVLFERAYSHYPLTLPSHCSIFTGLLPTRHGVRDNAGFSLDASKQTLAERLAKEGYATFGAASSSVLRASTGVAQGFQTYDAPEPAPTLIKRTHSDRSGTEVIDSLLNWLKPRPASDRFFAFVHLFEPHAPYRPPQFFADQYEHPYDAEVAYVDQLFGTLIRALDEQGRADNTVVILLSDHGEGLGDHVEREHGLTLYNEVLHVPLMIRLPDRRDAGKRVSTPVGLIDLFPTILDLLRIPVSEDLDGEALLTQNGARADRLLYSETLHGAKQYSWSELRSLIRNERHYIDSPTPKLFDMVQDPAEQQNLLPGQSPPSALIAALSVIGEGLSNAVDVSDAERAELASLGYVGTGSRSGTDSAPGDPDELLPFREELWRFIDPSIHDWQALPAERVRFLLDRLNADSEWLLRASARALRHTGAIQDAYQVLLPTSDSNDPLTQLLFGDLALELNQLQEAQDRYLKAAQLAPTSAEAQTSLGLLLLGEGAILRAKGHLQRAVELDSTRSEAWNGLGVAHAQQGEFKPAAVAWERATALDGSFSDAWFNLALAQRQLGDIPAAIRSTEQFIAAASPPEQAQGRQLLRELRGQR